MSRRVMEVADMIKSNPGFGVSLATRMLSRNRYASNSLSYSERASLIELIQSVASDVPKKTVEDVGLLLRTDDGRLNPKEREALVRTLITAAPYCPKEAAIAAVSVASMGRTYLSPPLSEYKTLMKVVEEAANVSPADVSGSVSRAIRSSFPPYFCEPLIGVRKKLYGVY